MGFPRASCRLLASPQTRSLSLFFAVAQLRVEGVHSRSLACRTFVSPTKIYGLGHGWFRWRTIALQELGLGVLTGNRGFSSGATEAAVSELKSSDGMTVDDIFGKGWPILDEAEGDWRSHAAAIAQSIHLIKRRLQWRKILVKAEELTMEMDKSDLWNDPVYAGKVSKEHGALMGKIKEINGFERELLEHIDMLKLAREENDNDVALVSIFFDGLNFVSEASIFLECASMPSSIVLRWLDPPDAMTRQSSLKNSPNTKLGQIRWLGLCLPTEGNSQHILSSVVMTGKLHPLMEVEVIENDGEVQESITALFKMRRIAKEKELEALLAGEHDDCSCFMEVQAGAGGTESMDWAAMILNMYKMWADRRGFSVSIVDEMPGEIAGIKRATIKVEGKYAFGYTKSEVGVHRLVRISPFDSGKRRHTSFAAVAVIPILGDVSFRVQINESDLRIERFRAGGAGGQHVNSTESAVRITHIPTGVTATCQNERSQHMNKSSAMSVLQSRLDQLEMARRAQLNAEHTQSLTEISWGNQIRSYVLHPYRMVKDLRTNYEMSDPDAVLEGDLDGFILNYLSSSLDTNNQDQTGARF